MAKKWRYFKTIRMKLIVPILCAIIVGELLMGYISHRINSSIIINAAISEGLNAARDLRQIIDLVISTAELDLSAIVLQPIVKPVIRELSTFSRNEPYFRSLEMLPCVQ